MLAPRAIPPPSTVTGTTTRVSPLGGKPTAYILCKLSSEQTAVRRPVCNRDKGSRFWGGLVGIPHNLWGQYLDHRPRPTYISMGLVQPLYMGLGNSLWSNQCLLLPATCLWQAGDLIHLYHTLLSTTLMVTEVGILVVRTAPRSSGHIRIPTTRQLRGIML